MKTLTTSKMCMLYCALFVCSFASAVRTANTSNTTVDTDTKNNKNKTVLDSNEDSIEKHEDWTITHPPKPEKTSIEILKYSSTTTPGTPSVTDLNEFTTEVLSNSTSQPKSDNSNNPSVTALPTNVVTWSKPKERVTTPVPTTTESRKKGSSKTKKTKWGHPSLSRITHILLSHKSRLQTMEEESKEQLKSPKYKRAKDICIYPDVRKYLIRCQNKAKATRKTRIQEQYENKQQTKVKTSAEIELEKIEKWKRDQEILDMDSKRFESILDIFDQYH
ncbi:uncharacterized protein LOC113554056 [Rhopalosiphum maidis]|uniref:uncharacterized protein LOC113554056 n=1 Tax=Rhopalosiphum maidis TaxID=43146 RepID=UPI000F001996|nr:uncharacterized protein LOC113554056 [Rhopalosiphum maidis]